MLRPYPLPAMNQETSLTCYAVTATSGTLLQAQLFAGQKQTLVMPGTQSNGTGTRILPLPALILYKQSATIGTDRKVGTVVLSDRTLVTQRLSRAEIKARQTKTLTHRLDG